MRFDNGKEIKEFTAMDSDVLEKIYKMKSLTAREKDILLSLCRHTFWQDANNVVHTSWWGAIDVTAQDVGCSRKTVQRAYKELARRNIILVTTKLNENTHRNTKWITINTYTNAWADMHMSQGTL